MNEAHPLRSNPMLARIIYAQWAPAEKLCVLRISTDVLDVAGTVVTDGNAASKYTTGFSAAPAGLADVDRDLTFAESWKHPNEIDEWRHKRAKCAEVLVPDRVPSRFILGAWVVGAETKLSLDAQLKPLACQVDAHLFFK